jgi:hypothetical protein
MTEGEYVNCSVRYVEWEGETGGDRWVEGVDVTITATWATILLPDGATKRFLRKTNKTLQIYPNMSRLQAEAERHKYRGKNSPAAEGPARLGGECPKAQRLQHR